mgnify:CR=1 FL=1
MKTILESFDRYYVRTHDDGSWDEVYDPNAATVFSSKKKAVEWAKECTTMEKYILPITDIDTRIKEFDEWVSNGMVCRTVPALNKKYNILFNSTKHDRMDVLKWLYNFSADPEFEHTITQEVYSSWNNVKYSNMFQHFRDMNAYEYAERYVSFSISVAPDSKFESFKEEIDLLLNNFEFDFLDDNGNLVIDITDNDLSETRSPFLVMIDRANNTWALIDRRYNSNNNYKVGPTTLEQCFNFMRKYWYYD